MARILIVEDDESVRTELVKLLVSAGHEAIQVPDFTDVAQSVLAASPDLVLLDLGLPQTDGQFVMRAIRQESQVPVIVLTSRASDLDELTSMSLGADKFIAKPYNGQILLAHIDAVLRRTMGATAERTIRRAGLAVDLVRSAASFAGQTVELSKNELRILELLLSRDGAVVSRQQLMEALWRTDKFVDDNTLTVNMNRLRATLGKIGARDLVVTHRGRGYSI